MTVPECHDDVCITCSDSAVEVIVIELLDNDLAIVEATVEATVEAGIDTGVEALGETRAGTGARREEVSVALVSAEVGDTILVHAREAIAVVRK
ncbi:MAG TPA: hydrogenase assembly protein HupF [Amycolatopsis sp.]|nr:hydrogenase assembly protein HupF [Amycolatopsis sp.]